MKKTIATLIVLFLSASVMVQGQTLKEVLDKHFKAIGQENLMAKKTYSVTAKVKQMGMELPMTMKMKRPDKFRMEMEMQGQKMIQVYNGKKGWVVAPWISSEPQELTGAQLQQAMDQADIDGELFNYEKKGSTAELVGKENDNGTELYNIKLTDKNGTVKHYYIDADSYLIRKVKSTINTQGQEVEIEQRMSDYDKTGGVMIARKIETKSPMGTAVITIEDVAFNEDMDDSLFDRP